MIWLIILTAVLSSAMTGVVSWYVLERQFRRTFKQALAELLTPPRPPN